jgi:hypothetical protein
MPPWLTISGDGDISGTERVPDKSALYGCFRVNNASFSFDK